MNYQGVLSFGRWGSFRVSSLDSP